MKKVMKLFGILSLITTILVGCNSSEEANAEKIAKEFAEELYTVDSDKIDSYNTLKKIENTQSLIETMESDNKTLKALTTEDAFDQLVSSRQIHMNTEMCASGNYTMQVTEFTLSENKYDVKEDKAGFDFEVKLKLISNKDKTEQTDAVDGYIGLLKEDGQWKVFSYKVFTYPKVLKEASNNK